MTPATRAATAVAVLTLAGAAARAIGLNSGLWYDEIVTLVESVRPPLVRIVTDYSNNNNHPLYSVLGHASTLLLGERAWTLRLPAALFGVATIPILYLLGRAVTTRLEACLAGLLLTFSYHHIWFSQNARGYTALAFCATLATYLFLRGLERERTAWFVAYAITAALGIYTHLSMAFVVATHLLIWVWLAWTGEAPFARTWRFAGWAFGLTAVLATLMYGPLLLQVQKFFLGRPRPATLATPQWAILEAVRGARLGLGAWGALLAALLGSFGLVSYLRSNRTFAACILLPGVFMALSTVALRRPVFPRFFLFLIGFAALAIVRGAMLAGEWLERAQGVRRRSASAVAVGVGLVTVLTIGSVLSLPGGYRLPKQDFEGATRFVEAARRNEEDVATVGLASYPYREYLRRPWTEVNDAAKLEAVRAGGRRLWVIYTFPEYIERESPDLARIIHQTCPTAAVFPGTVGGGDVVVCTVEGAGSKLARP